MSKELDARVHCEGNCVYGDDPQNGYRDANQDTYDGLRCHCVQCINKEVCGNRWVPQEYCNPQCISCKIYAVGTLEFRECPPETVCAVCMESDQQVKFPRAGCTHWFCVACTRLLVYGDEGRYYLDPRAFGCPPCPNGCDNPIRGKQCFCEDYDSVKDEWELQKKSEYDEWLRAEDELCYAEEPGSAFGKGECPLCRR